VRYCAVAYRTLQHGAQEILVCMSSVRIEKIAAVPEPVVPPGDPATYGYGVVNSEASLPIGYWLCGTFRSEPAVGERMVVDRNVRNGIVRKGVFTSSVVVRIEGDRVCTANSVYHVASGDVFPPPENEKGLP